MGYRSRETQESTPPIFLEVHTTLEEIPDPPNCPVCADPMNKSFIVYSFDADPQFTFEHLAGYRCDDCEYSKGSELAIYEAHASALAYLETNRLPGWENKIKYTKKNLEAAKRTIPSGTKEQREAAVR